MEENRHAAVVAVIAVFTTLTTVAVAARLYTRKIIVRNVGIDDSELAKTMSLRTRLTQPSHSPHFHHLDPGYGPHRVPDCL